ncbi:hypothetical protein HYW74_00260 [Candidatus Pacearchaeota archaeon]|nr:hypothetical protein [Candidatus Pacearchaeota archaeon]
MKISIIGICSLLVSIIFFIFNQVSIGLTFFISGLIVVLWKLLSKREIKITHKTLAFRFVIYLIIVNIIIDSISYFILKRPINLIGLIWGILFILLGYLFLGFIGPKYLEDITKTKFNGYEKMVIIILTLLMLGILILTMIILLRFIINQTISYLLIIIDIIFILTLSGTIYFMRKNKRLRIQK